MKESQKKWVRKQDPIVEIVVKDFWDRSSRGVEKYNTTLKENNTDNFFKHLREELMDGILYLAKIEDVIKTTPNNTELGEKIRRMCN
jgi:hypothetical protein